MRQEKTLERYLRRLLKYPLIVIDELGYIPFSEEGAQLLFQVLSDRHERGSVIVTSNLPFSEWTQVFGDANLTAALLDRLTHRSHILNFDWQSIRFAESLKRHKPQATAMHNDADQTAKNPRKEVKNQRAKGQQSA